MVEVVLDGAGTPVATLRYAWRTVARKPETEIQEMLDASQEVAREAIATVLRVAKERKVDPARLLRVSFQSLQGMTWSMMPPRPEPPQRKPSPRKRAAKKPS